MAEAIAKAIGDSTTIIKPVDLLFIGDGIYFGKPNKNTVRFISKLDPAIVKKIAVFGTYGGQAIL